MTSATSVEYDAPITPESSQTSFGPNRVPCLGVVIRLLPGFGHLQNARALEIRISEQAALEEDHLASCIAG
jgi:hypothetical protein